MGDTSVGIDRSPFTDQQQDNNTRSIKSARMDVMIVCYYDRRRIAALVVCTGPSRRQRFSLDRFSSLRVKTRVNTYRNTHTRAHNVRTNYCRLKFQR